MSYVSMEKAARMLLVSRSTVLKWIMQQRLSARRTADGGYLVNRDSLLRLLISSEKFLEETVNETRPIIPCWEYNAEGGVVKQSCRACPVFRDKRLNCYEAGKFLKESGLGASCCPTDCEDCSYYKSRRRAEQSGSEPPPAANIPPDSRAEESN